MEETKDDRRRVVHTSDKSKERFHNFLSPSRVSCPVAHLHVDVQVIVPCNVVKHSTKERRLEIRVHRSDE